MHYPYEAFLNGTGLTIKLFRIQWYTTALNRITIKWAHSYPKIFKYSFDAGVLASICLLPAMLLWQMKPYIVGAFSSAAESFHAQSAPSAEKTTTTNSGIEFELMLPGVNLPFDEIGYYVIS